MKLKQVIKHLKDWQEAERKAGRSRSSRCLEAVRAACLKEGLKLPPPMARPKNTALANFKVLTENPEQFGWVRVHSPLCQPCLVYFKKCGTLPDGRIAGHIAIFDPETGFHYANNNWRFSQWWADRIVGAFVPVE